MAEVFRRFHGSGQRAKSAACASGESLRRIPQSMNETRHHAYRRPATAWITGIRGRIGSRIGSFHFTAKGLLVALALLFISTPFLEQLKRGAMIEALLITLVFIASILAVGGGPRTMFLTTFLAFPTITFKWLNQWWPGMFPPWGFLACAMVFGLFVVFNLLRFVLRASRVDNEVLSASIAAYLMLGLFWSFAYLLVAQVTDHGFNFAADPATLRQLTGFEAFYFSFATLSTVGYGDITPVHKVARMLAVMEAMVGLLYTAVLIARLVALQTSAGAEKQTRDLDSDKT